MPAFFYGIFGHKSTTGNFGKTLEFLSILSKHFLLGIVPNAGQQPVAERDTDAFLVTGPMSRYCIDLMTMFRVLAAPNIHKLKLDTKASSLN
jgi:fatty acid amide hydrolase 2